MKRFKTFVMAPFLIIAMCFGFVGCGPGGPGPGVETFTVTFNLMGGSHNPYGSAPQFSVEKGATANLDINLWREGENLWHGPFEEATLLGWTTTPNGSSFFNANTPINSNLSLYARWAENGVPVDMYKITLDQQGGEGAIVHPYVREGLIQAPGQSPTKAGHWFLGWYTTPSFTEMFEFNKTVVNQDISLYARWTNDEQNFLLNTLQNSRNFVMEFTATITDARKIGNYNWIGVGSLLEPVDFENWEVVNYELTYRLERNNNSLFTEVYVKTTGDTTRENGKRMLSAEREEPLSASWRTANFETTDFTRSISDIFPEWNTPWGWSSPPEPSWSSAPISVHASNYINLAREISNSNWNASAGTLVASGETCALGLLENSLNLFFANIAILSNGTATNEMFNWAWTASRLVVDWPSSPKINWSLNFETNTSDSFPGNSYVITFNTDGGTAVETQNRWFYENVTRPAQDPTKRDYVFQGWFAHPTQGSAQWTFNEKVSGDTTIYARWREMTAYEKYGGVWRMTECRQILGPTNTNVKGNFESILRLHSDYTAESIGDVLVWNNAISQNVDRWEVDSNIIYFYRGNQLDGAGLLERLSNGDIRITIDGGGGSSIVATFTRLGDIGNFLATFDTLGGSNVSAQDLEIGELVTRPANPTKTDEFFVGWFTHPTEGVEFNFNNTFLAENTTIYARWTDVNPMAQYAGTWVLSGAQMSGGVIGMINNPNAPAGSVTLELGLDGAITVVKSNLDVTFGYSNYIGWELWGTGIMRLSYQAFSTVYYDDFSIMSVNATTLVLRVADNPSLLTYTFTKQ
jgi:uncharacterized repeat protein (TIGR02543 family)